MKITIRKGGLTKKQKARATDAFKGAVKVCLHGC